MESLKQDTKESSEALRKIELPDSELRSAFITTLTDDTSKLLYLEGLRHDLLGMLKIPTIGKYSNQGYDFAPNISLATFHISPPDSSGICEVHTDGSVNKCIKIVLPSEIKDLLNNIPNPIPQNSRMGLTGADDGTEEKKAEAAPKKDNFSKQGKKGAKGSKEEQDMEADLDSLNLASDKPYAMSDALEFTWIISLNTLQDVAKTSTTKKKNQKKPSKQEEEEEKADKKADDGQILLNYVVHPWLFPVVDFSKKYREFKMTPLAMITTPTTNALGLPREDIHEFIEGEKSKAKRFNGIKFGAVRLEYSSIHLKGPSLCFSPNNLRFLIKPDAGAVSDFWTVILDKGNKAHKIFYHWMVNADGCNELIESACRSCKSIDGFIDELEGVLGKENQPIQNCRNIFKFMK